MATSPECHVSRSVNEKGDIEIKPGAALKCPRKTSENFYSR